MLWSGVKAVGWETLRTGGRILSDVADNTAGDVKPRHIIAKHVSDSAQTYSKTAGQCPYTHRATIEGLPRRRRRGPRRPELQNGHLCIGRFIPYPTMAADVVSAISEFDMFATRPVQSSTIETIETAYKPIASLDQSDFEFLIPADHDTYIDLNIQLYIRGKLTQADGKDLELTDVTCVANNLLHTISSN